MVAMNSEAQEGLAGRPYASMLPNGQQAPWQISHETIDNSLHLSFGQSQDPSIDPQLRSEGTIPSSSTPSAHQPHPSTNGQDVPQSIDSQGSSAKGLRLAPCELLAQRHLPSQDVSDETFDDAYAAFILYCNPSIPLHTDTTELRKAFRNPPKSDGKNFNPFTLFELIRKLELKEIKTWAQLAIELGVEPPVVDKGQSAQKVQQYAVRLKRWMHAMHVDAFFEYLLHKSHAYWTQIPPVDDTPSEFGRDGVSPEEDLALRALLPETRPKRGRRKAEDRDNDSDLARSPAQKPRIHSPTPSDDFGIGRAPVIDTPASARSDFVMNSSQLGPWSASDARLPYGAHVTGGHQNCMSAQSPSIQWRPRDSDQTPFTPHPHSAITPRSGNPFLPYDDEPQSAVTPSKSRSRRRHGPAVSSAWPSSGNTAAGKLRGRPPSNRSTSDGPFSTFPANPNAKTGPTISLRDNPAVTPTVENSAVRNSSFIFPPPLPLNNRPATKPSGLHLQVPERKGGAVRLATPPPTLLVNGESEADAPADEALSHEQETAPTMDCMNCAKAYSHFDPNAMATADDGISQNNEPPPRAHQFTNLSSCDEPGKDRTNTDMVELQIVYATLHADWYNNTGQPTERCSLDEAYRIASQIICKLRVESSSKETFLMSLAALTGGRSLGMFLEFTRLENNEDANNYRAKWTMKYGSVEGSFDLEINVPRRPPTKPQESAGGPEGEAAENRTTDFWKNKYVELHGRTRERDQKIKELRKSMLEALLVVSQDGDV